MDDNVRKAYAAWTEAKAEYWERLERLMAGDLTANDGIDEVLKRLRQTHEDFMAAAAPYMRRATRT